MSLTFAGMFSGAGGLDLGFEMAGFEHTVSTDWEENCIDTLRSNRPSWNVEQVDARDFSLGDDGPDVLLAGFPCQGFSLGGNRKGSDSRNQLYREVVRVVERSKPRVVVIENVLNLRNMKVPHSGKPFADEIASAFEKIGYDFRAEFLRMSGFGVPQTRRRFVLVGFLKGAPDGYELPAPSGEQGAAQFLQDMVNGPSGALPNHAPEWGFKSRVHKETGTPFPNSDCPVPVRFSRTASDGNPVRNLLKPFPAIDTATIWGWAQGNVVAERVEVDRSDSARFVRNRETDLRLWRISASRLRAFTDREYARLQTFPDDWVFVGKNKRAIHKQVGNAVPVEFARRLGANIMYALECLKENKRFQISTSGDTQMSLPLYEASATL